MHEAVDTWPTIKRLLIKCWPHIGGHVNQVPIETLIQGIDWHSTANAFLVQMNFIHVFSIKGKHFLLSCTRLQKHKFSHLPFGQVLTTVCMMSCTSLEIILICPQKAGVLQYIRYLNFLKQNFPENCTCPRGKWHTESTCTVESHLRITLVILKPCYYGRLVTPIHVFIRPPSNEIIHMKSQTFQSLIILPQLCSHWRWLPIILRPHVHWGRVSQHEKQNWQ